MRMEAECTAAAAVHEIKAGVDVVFQIPQAPRAVLFIAHEGNGTPFTYWTPAPQLPSCTGVPDHVAIVKQALARGYAVIAVKSVKSFWQDWPPQASQDAYNVKWILSTWKAEHRLEGVPLVGLGTDSGANFLSMLALHMNFSALLLMVSAGLQKAFAGFNNGTAVAKYPAILFIHMPKDQLTASKVQQHREMLKSKSVPVGSIICEEFPITPFYFSTHIAGLGSDASSKLYSAMQTQGIIDIFGRVLYSPKVQEIGALLLKFDVLPLQRGDNGYISVLTEHINSLMRVAEGRHAVTARKCPEAFNWLEHKIWGHPAPVTFTPPPLPQRKLDLERSASQPHEEQQQVTPKQDEP